MAWRPRPSWVIQSGVDATIDVSDHWLSWEVQFGCLYEARSGRWVLVTASGHIELDNSSGLFDTGAAGSLIDPTLIAVPRPITLTLGGETLWQGLVIIAGAVPLRGDSTVTWALKGRNFQALQTLAAYRQLGGPASPESVAAGILTRSTKRTGMNEISPGSAWPTGVTLKDVKLLETLGQSWNRLAHTCGSIPFEDRTGRLGISSLQQIASGRQLDAPDYMHALDVSRLGSVGTQSLWGIDVVGRNTVDQPSATLVSVSGIVDTRLVAARYDYPSDTSAVRWSDPQVQQPGWTVVSFEAHPAPDGTRADILRAVVRKDVASALQATCQFVGVRTTEHATEPYEIKSESPEVSGLPDILARTQTTEPWIDHGAAGASTDAFAKMVQFLTEAKAEAVLTYPLWASSESERLLTNVDSRSGLLVPGSVSRYRIAGSRVIDGITGTVRLHSNTQDDSPKAEVHVYTASGAGSPDHPVETGIMIPGSDVIISPWDVPPPPPPTNTPTDTPIPGAKSVNGGWFNARAIFGFTEVRWTGPANEASTFGPPAFAGSGYLVYVSMENSDGSPTEQIRIDCQDLDNHRNHHSFSQAMQTGGSVWISFVIGSTRWQVTIPMGSPEVEWARVGAFNRILMSNATPLGRVVQLMREACLAYDNDPAIGIPELVLEIAFYVPAG